MCLLLALFLFLVIIWMKSKWMDSSNTKRVPQHAEIYLSTHLPTPLSSLPGSDPQAKANRALPTLPLTHVAVWAMVPKRCHKRVALTPITFWSQVHLAQLGQFSCCSEFMWYKQILQYCSLYLRSNEQRLTSPVSFPTFLLGISPIFFTPPPPFPDLRQLILCLQLHSSF